MPKEYDNTNRGVLFKNDEKKGEAHPDYKGRINTNGQDFWLSAWLKTAKDGRKYMSLSVNPMEQQQRLAPKVDGPIGEMEDDIPF